MAKVKFKKALALLLGLLVCLSAVGCAEKDNQTEKNNDRRNIFHYIIQNFKDHGNKDQFDFDIAVDISFYQDGNKKVPFTSDEFDVNTRIYVCVDFTVTKNVDAKEVIAFEVQIPYAEYYSTKDFYAGTIIPHENEYTQQDLHGNEYTVKELNQMNFVFDDNESHDYHYIFEIEANQPCESADFIVRFKPENSNLSVSVNGLDDNKSQISYTFTEAGD